MLFSNGVYIDGKVVEQAVWRKGEISKEKRCGH